MQRRRTQIRVAQRAYRARKDSTIIDLQSQVDELRSVLQDATTNLQVISDKLAIDDDRLSARTDLHSTITKLMELHKTVEAVKNESNSDDNQTSLRQSTESDGPLPKSHPDNASYAEGIDSSTRSAKGYSIENDPEPHYADAIDAALSEVNIAWLDPFLKATNSEHTGGVFTKSSLLAKGIPSQLAAVPTFSWQETTFARRLMRHSHELCLRHLENPSEKYGLMLNKARYSLTFMSEEALIRKLKTSVAKSKSDPLEDWTMPVLHVGGAGKYHEWNPEEEGDNYRFTQDRNVGPFQIPSAAFPIPTSLFPDKVAEWLGLDGVWLDHRDVEAYLRSKGLKLDSAASTTTFEISSSSDSWPEINDNMSNMWLNSPSLVTSEPLDFMQLPERNSPVVGYKRSQRYTGVAVGDYRSTNQVILSVDRLIEGKVKHNLCYTI